MWSSETGARVMKRIGAPVIGDMVSSTVLTSIIIPIVYEIWRAWELRREAARDRRDR
jgi:Cu(I)/Ag(I) efflux system membrane protein CusA/SilA